jgi:hypothetical protein
MILIGLVTTIWIAFSLLGVAVCRAAGVADRQQQKPSWAGRTDRIASTFVSRSARIRTCQSAIRTTLLGASLQRPCLLAP